MHKHPANRGFLEWVFRPSPRAADPGLARKQLRGERRPPLDELVEGVGFYSRSDEVFRGFLLDSHGFKDIEYPDADITGAWGINDLKRIVGGYGDTSGVFHGFLLKKGVFTVDTPRAPQAPERSGSG